MPSLVAFYLLLHNRTDASAYSKSGACKYSRSVAHLELWLPWSLQGAEPAQQSPQSDPNLDLADSNLVGLQITISTLNICLLVYSLQILPPAQLPDSSSPAYEFLA